MNFNKAKATRDLWERRTSFQSPSTPRRPTKASSPSGSSVTSSSLPPVTSSEDGDETPLAKGGFRNNRDFWEQRVTMRQKQTPDLVMDLPLSTSPKNSLPPTAGAGAAAAASAGAATAGASASAAGPQVVRATPATVASVAP